MAEAELDLDEKKPEGKRHLVLYIIIALLVGALAVTGTLLMMGDSGGEEEAPAELAVKEAHYLPLEKLTVNFGEGGPARYLQLDIQVMSHEPAALGTVEKHMPAVRNDILLLLSSQSYDSISTREGKEALRAQIKAIVNGTLLAQDSEAAVEAVYFTNFVMQ